MATVTIVSGGISRSSLPCGLEERLENPSTIHDQPLVTTTEKRMELSFEAALLLLKEIEIGEPSEWRWKAKTFFLAMSLPFVVSISFVPIKLDVQQKLFATRGSCEGYLKLEEYGSFWKRRDLRPLNDFAGIEAQQMEEVKSVVNAFSNDEQTGAIALTVKRFDKIQTFIWSKKIFFQ